MRSALPASLLVLPLLAAGLSTCRMADPAQLAAFPSAEDAEFFLNGTMSAEFIPERVFRAFLTAYPELFPGGDVAAYGAIRTAPGELPVGFTRRTVAHLGGQPSLGINCAACHVGEVQEAPDAPPILVIGKPSRLDIYAFSGAVAVSLLRTSSPEGMIAFLPHYLRAGGAGEEAEALLEKEVERRKDAIAAAVAADPFGSKSIAPGELHEIAPESLELDLTRLEGGMDLVPLSEALLRLFYNMRTALHIPEELPGPVPTLPGPGRTDAFGTLARAFFAFPARLEAPVKFGIVWDLEDRKWVHWDGNNDQPLARNLGAAFGLGAPITGRGRLADFKAIDRHTAISERLRAPRYPWAVDRESAARGAAHYAAHCASCHDVRGEPRLFPIEEVGTDPNRALFFDEEQARLLNEWVAAFEVPGYDPPAVSFRSTRQYVAPPLAGVWARSPYLHNGAVRTMWELLAPPAERPRSFRIGSPLYDQRHLGHAGEGPFLFDCSLPGNSNAGHDYGTALGEAEKRELIEYLKTL
jgi:mono/diheme cytochrome c family protein